MAYAVAQLVKNINSTYMQPVSVSSAVINSLSPFEKPAPSGDNNNNNSNSYYQDFAVASTFEPNKTYYLRFEILKVPEYYYSGVDELHVQSFAQADVLGFTLVLTNDETPQVTQGDTVQVKDAESIGSFSVPKKAAIESDQEEDYASYSFVFTPASSYRYLCFKMNRITYDAWFKGTNYRKWLDPSEAASTVARYTDTSGSTKQITVPAFADRIHFNGVTEDSDICSLVNLVNKNDGWLKIGYQSRPGSLIVVNQQPIIVGRSGIYELNNGTKINSFMIACPNGSTASNMDAFLLDYAYEQS